MSASAILVEENLASRIPVEGTFTIPPRTNIVHRDFSTWDTVQVGADKLSYRLQTHDRGVQLNKQRVDIRVEVPSKINGKQYVTYARMNLEIGTDKAAFQIVEEYHGVKVDEERQSRMIGEIRKLLAYRYGFNPERIIPFIG